MDSPSTSFHLKNEKVSAQLSLLEHEEATSTSNILNTGQKSSANFIIVPGWEPKITPPPKYPSHEKVYYCRFLYNFVVTLFLTLIFLLCLPILILTYLLGGLIPRFFVRLLLECSNGGRYKLMTASRAFGSNENNHHTAVLVIRGKCDVEKIRLHMMNVISSIDINTGQRKFLHLQKRVSQKFGYLCLENRYSRFDIKNHVKHFDIRRKNLVLNADDIIPYLESTFDEPFENDSTVPQWEVLVVPKYAYRKDEARLLSVDSDQSHRFYAVIFRFHNGVMSWNMFQELLVEFLGKTKGRVRSSFCPPSKRSCWESFKIFFALLFVAPQTWLKQWIKRWKPFAPLRSIPRVSYGMTKTIDSEAFEDVKTRTYTSIDAVLATCVRVAVRNIVLGQNLDLPDDLKIARIYNTMTSNLQGLDYFNVNYHKYRIALERLQGTFHAIERRAGVCSLAGQRIFNKVLIHLAGVFPSSISGWMMKTLLKSDIILEIWPASDEPCKIFGNEMVVDIFGWAGISGVDADFKATVTSYCGRVRINFTGKLGYIENLTDAQFLAYEFEEEFKKLAATGGLYQSRIFLPPAVYVGNGF